MGTNAALLSIIVVAATASLIPAYRGPTSLDKSNLENIIFLCNCLCLVIFAIHDLPKGRSVWEIGTATKHAVILMSCLIPFLNLCRVVTRDLPAEGETNPNPDPDPNPDPNPNPDPDPDPNPNPDPDPNPNQASSCTRNSSCAPPPPISR